MAPSVRFVMVMRDARRLLTPEEFLMHPAARGAGELVRGEVREMTPASGAHGVIAGVIFAALHRFVEQHQLGLCFPDNTGFLLPGLDNTVRSPDAAFVRAERLPVGGIGAGWMSVAPDLVVEIVSPTESGSDLEEKLLDYRAAGTALAWVVDPVARVVSVRSVNARERRVGEEGILEGGDVLPGFTLPVATLFERLAK